MAGEHLITPIVAGPGNANTIKDSGTVNPGTGSDATPQVAVLTVGLGNNNTALIYAGPAAAAINANTVCTVNPTTGAITAAAGNHTTLQAIASGEYAWCRQTATFQT